MLLTKRELPILIVNLIYVPYFTVVALQHANYEFILYVAVILLVGLWLVLKQSAIQFTRTILWGLTGWGLLHMAGGNVRVHGDVLYGLQLVSLIPSYDVLRYDQVVHMWGFGVATLMCHHLLRPYLRPDIDRWWPLAILVVLMGCGLGAINEVVEFVAVVTMPKTGVGGYTNTLLDLVFNLFGAVIAVIWLARSRSYKPPV